jgi:uncharacterized membrane protein
MPPAPSWGGWQGGVVYFIFGLIIVIAFFIALFIYNNKNWWEFNKRIRRRK